MQSANSEKIHKTPHEKNRIFFAHFDCSVDEILIVFE